MRLHGEVHARDKSPGAIQPHSPGVADNRAIKSRTIYVVGGWVSICLAKQEYHAPRRIQHHPADRIRAVLVEAFSSIQERDDVGFQPPASNQLAQAST